MEFISKTARLHRRKPSHSIVICINKSSIVTTPLSDYTYRTEVYLQQREKQHESKISSLRTITTWKNLMQQKRILETDQAEIDRVLSTIESIHGTFNRSFLLPYNQVYASLYGDDDKSARLMKTFCQRQDYYINYDLSIKEDDDDSNTQDISNSFGNFQEKHFDDNTENEEEEEEENEEEKKNSYDSGYGSVMPMRHYSREPRRKN